MKQIAFILLIAALIGGSIFIWQKSQKIFNLKQLENQKEAEVSNSDEKNLVKITNFAFNPKSITIKAGESITWKNSDLVGHSATADDNSWDTGVFSQNESQTVTFEESGTFSYHCSPHPFMKGVVVVE